MAAQRTYTYIRLAHAFYALSIGVWASLTPAATSHALSYALCPRYLRKALSRERLQVTTSHSANLGGQIRSQDQSHNPRQLHKDIHRGTRSVL
jgi:hypothetical protein